MGTLLLAALTAPDPALPDRDWSWVDWTVIGLGTGSGLAVLIKRSGWPRKKQADDSSPTGKRERPAKGEKAPFTKKKPPR